MFAGTPGVPASEQLEKLLHDKYHLDTLLTMYPDLQTKQCEKNIIDYYSASVNPHVDAALFDTQNISGYTNIHNLNPYKNIKISCKYCDGDLGIHSIPSKIPLFLYYGSSYGAMADQFINVMAYEDFCKIHGISQDVIGKSHIYILNWLDEFGKKPGNTKLNLSFINQSLKRLLPFM